MRKMFHESVKLNVALFYACYTIIVSCYALRQTVFLSEFASTLNTAAEIVLVFVCLMNIFKMPKKTVLAMLAVLCLAFFTKLHSSSSILLPICLLVIAAKNIHLEKIIKYDIKLKILLLILTTSFYFAGLTLVNTHIRTGGQIRQSMGFDNPNGFSEFVLSIIMEIMYLQRKKIGWKEILITLIGIAVIGYFSDGRTSMLCLLIALIGLLFLKHKDGRLMMQNKVVKFIIPNLFTILTILTLTMAVSYSINSQIMQQLNSITSGRIALSSEAIHEYSITLFGNTIETADYKVTLDNVFMYITIAYGIIPTAIICLLIREYMLSANRNAYYTIVIIMTAFIIGGMAEKFCLRIQFNIFLLYFAYMLYGNPEVIPKKLNSENPKE